MQAELVELVEKQEKTVVIIMHSYGGLVGSEAIPENLAYEFRRSKGLTGGVSYLILYAAFILGVGQSVLGVFGESPSNDILVS